MPNTFKTSVVIAVMTRHIIPGVTMLGAKSVNTIFVFPVVRLLWGPEPKTIYFFVCPHKRALHTSVIESDPGSLSVGTVLNIDVFILVVNCYQTGTHRRTVWYSSEPRATSATCKVTVATKIAPTWLANTWEIDATFVELRYPITSDSYHSMYLTFDKHKYIECQPLIWAKDTLKSCMKPY